MQSESNITVRDDIDDINTNMYQPLSYPLSFQVSLTGFLMLEIVLLEAGGWLSWQVESTGSQVYAGPPGGRILTSQPSRAPGVQFPELAPGQAGDIPLPSLVTTRVLLGLD